MSDILCGGRINFKKSNELMNSFIRLSFPLIVDGLKNLTKNQSTAVEAIDLPPKKKTSANNYFGNLFLVKRFNKNNNKRGSRKRGKGIKQVYRFLNK